MYMLMLLDIVMNISAFKSGLYGYVEEELKRNRERLLQALENISYGKLSGAVGTYSNLSE